MGAIPAYLKPVRDETHGAALFLLAAVVLLVGAGPVGAESAATISGRVTAADTGQGLSEVKVRAMPGDFRDLTDDRGRFILRNLPPGQTYWLSFFREEFPYVNEFSSVDVTVPADRFFFQVERALTPGGAVSGAVWDDRGGGPLYGAAVSATCLGHPPWVEHNKMTRTDEDGRYLLQGLPESETCVIAAAVYGHAWVKQTTAVAAGAVSGNVDFVIGWQDPTGISGFVRRAPDGQPLVSARVALSDDAGNIAGIALTSVSGEFSIMGVEPGLYHATASSAGKGGLVENLRITPGVSTHVDFLIEMPEEPEPPPDSAGSEPGSG
jgi:hypothetical protein